MADRYLEGRAAWVTGGATGMGRAIALALAEAGADVAIGSLVEDERDNVVDGQCVYLLSDDEMESARADIEARGVRAMARGLEVCSTRSVEDFYQATVQAFGKIDILVNGAGCSGRNLVAGHSDALWHRIIDINLNGPYRTSKVCLPAMIERGWGRIVNLASTAANVGAVAHAAYCAGKSGQLGLMRCIALEGAEHGVTCNAINPGSVETPQSAIAAVQQMKIDGIDVSPEDYRAQVAEAIPQKRWVEREEIAAFAAYLCRDEAFAITGQDITIAAGSNW